MIRSFDALELYLKIKKYLVDNGSTTAFQLWELDGTEHVLTILLYLSKEYMGKD